MAAAWAAICSVIGWLLCAVGVLLAVVLGLLLIILLVPVFVRIVYDEAQDESLSVSVGMLCVRLHLYPRIYFLWDKYKDESPEETEARLAVKKAKQKVKDAEKKAKKEAEKQARKLQGTGEKKFKLSLHLIVTLVQSAGMVMKLILSALRIEQIVIRLPIKKNDPAKTAIAYGKINAGVYGSLGFLNRFLYLDFKELQITPVFEENFERTSYFSCKVSAQLFIIVVVAYRLFQTLRQEEELLALLRKPKPRKGAATPKKS